MSRSPLLSIQDLKVEFNTDDGPVVAVDGVSFELFSGETVAMVGESGSGKSVTALALMRLLEHGGGRIVRGSLLLSGRDGGPGQDLKALSQQRMRRLRGNDLSMIFQEPMTSLNPVFPVGEQIAEVLRLHRQLDGTEARRESCRLLERVHLPDPEAALKRFPHELSGGMRQRVMIAMALACRPRLLIADEPTTALDVTIQAQILELMRELQREFGMTVMFITHDMGVVAEIADRVIVMKDGRKLEEGEVDTLFARPRHPYTKALLAAVPRLGSMRGRAKPERFNLLDWEGKEHPVPRAAPTARTEIADAIPQPGAPNALLGVRNLTTRFPVRRGFLKRTVGHVHAVTDVSFEIRAGETLALVGESGCGKSTTGRSILRLVEPSAGKVTLDGRDVLALSRNQMRRARRDMQIVFQDPFASLNPRLNIFDLVAEPLIIHGIAKGSELQDRVERLIERVGLTADHLKRHPHEFSGGQRQRISIARALSLNPRLIIADEPVSALDVSIQAQIVNLMMELQEELGLSYLFISHDMAVVERMSHRVAVMRMGRIVEIGPRDAVFSDPQHAYTRILLASVPIADPAKRQGRKRTAPPETISCFRPIGDEPPKLEMVTAAPDHLVAVAEAA